MPSDRNLLFGILALQMDFVSRDALVKGMNAWVLEKAKSLGQILVEQRTLAPDERALLESLVHKHLERHGNDAAKSLAAVSSLGSVRSALEQVSDLDVQASLVHVAVGRPDEADPSATCDYAVGTAVGTPTSAGLRFRILRPHARGGLGQVFVARDEELHREVALKEIQDEHADHPDRRARFLLEAEITGGLEHPGIVPVYGLGQHPDGRPFYAMRFIKGDSLKEAIERFHEAEVPGRDMGERALAFRQLLGRFVDVCNAIAYAHSRGVLHRDLKPGNIMLGPYGETLVVDWGLAKAGGKRETPGAFENGAEEPTLRPSSASGSAPTQMGKAIGTPQYMPPEQAAGRLDELGPASDVYSLGATLYCLLAGKAPFENAEVGLLLQRVGRGEFPAPRQVKGFGVSVPAPLEAVCLKAMALKPADRYPSPRALADDIEHWLADEPVSAWPEPMTVKASRWMRRHKAGVSGAAAAVLVGLIALTGGIIWYQRHQAEAARKLALSEQEIGQALDQAQEVRDALQKKLRQPGGVFELLNHPEDWQARNQMAQGSLERARALLASVGEGVDPALKGRADQLGRLLQEDEDDRLLAVLLEKIRMDQAAWVKGSFDAKKAAAKYPKVFIAAGLGDVSGDLAPVVQRIMAWPIKEQVVAALDDWAWVAWRLGNKELPDELLAVARAAAPDSAWGDRLRQSRIWRNQEILTALAKEAPATGLSPQLLCLLGRLLAQENPLTQSWLRPAQARFPADFWLNFDLANALEKSDAVEAAGFYRVALAIRPGSIAAYNNLGNVLGAQHKLPEAIAAFRTAIALDPKFAVAYNNLGNAFRNQQKLPEAIAAFRTAIALNPNYALAYYNLGNVLGAQHKLPEAIAAFRKAIALDPKFAGAYYSLGLALYYQNKLLKAIAAYRTAIKVNPVFAEAYCKLGHALLAQGEMAQGLAALRRGDELGRQSAGWKLPSFEWVRNAERLAKLERNLPAILSGKQQPASAGESIQYAQVCHPKGLYAAAARFYEQAFAADPKLAEDLKTANRYHAACAACLSAWGRGKDSAKLDDQQRTHWRRQAVTWLNADLALWAKQLASGKAQDRVTVQRILSHWQEDTDLASIREAAALAKLPAAEQAACHKLWADVAALLKKAAGKP